MITQKYLKTILRYTPETGDWTWIARRRGVTMWQKAGTPDAEGRIRIRIRIDGVKIYASRLAWLYMTGERPDDQIDHINRINNDDRWRNLRKATRSENCTNTIHPKRKHFHLPRGVTTHPGGYQAKISIKGVRKFLGLFDTPEAAREAYQEASKFREEYLPKEAANGA